jgi:hypothetical protein
MSWKHLNDKTVRGKKDYNCFLCGEEIPAGSRQVVRSGVSDERFLTMRMHLECEAATTTWDNVDWESFEEGDMRRPKPKGETETSP